MTYDECYVWLAARIHRAVEKSQERVVQLLVDQGRAEWMPRRRVASCYQGGRTRRYARALGLGFGARPTPAPAGGKEKT